ncbi:hypothetical protein PoB_004259800 [Plakobranchus ocellatus]|uniref:Uncharacterized protein n=1 Tax=Plakobranchus ocellatus TaxID=259542 RepID=A0AAV4BBA1_9GAST|nr:hypothetical protein PoB_004259800 [Plakobranchus ocellatus]
MHLLSRDENDRGSPSQSLNSGVGTRMPTKVAKVSVVFWQVQPMPVYPSSISLPTPPPLAPFLQRLKRRFKDDLDFKHLVFLITSDARCDIEIKKRVAIAKKTHSTR